MNISAVSAKPNYQTDDQNTIKSLQDQKKRLEQQLKTLQQGQNKSTKENQDKIKELQEQIQQIDLQIQQVQQSQRDKANESRSSNAQTDNTGSSDKVTMSGSSMTGIIKASGTYNRAKKLEGSRVAMHNKKSQLTTDAAQDAQARPILAAKEQAEAAALGAKESALGIKQQSILHDARKTVVTPSQSGQTDESATVNPDDQSASVSGTAVAANDTASGVANDPSKTQHHVRKPRAYQKLDVMA